ncbi:MAG: SPOR domain-containing protein [Acidobacteria bacterium]|nr:SPOR domain-containing protein [Acidobacteriota bacterium]MBV9186974.1 SPOR domain-containing protein [Acidobacteriota bacterium]
MSDEVLIDDQSHYEVSLTAGQAFVAFVLLLLSLAASFAFGLMIGKGQADERLVVRKEPAVINEGSVIASKKNDSKLVDLGVGNDDFKAPPPATTSAAPAPAPAITEGTITPLTESAPAPITATAAPIVEAPKPAPKPPVVVAPVATGPAYAQLLVTSDQKTADALAAKAIDHGFMTTYVERAGTSFKVRVKFNSEAEARASEAKLKEVSKDVWIVK